MTHIELYFFVFIVSALFFITAASDASVLLQNAVTAQLVWLNGWLVGVFKWWLYQWYRFLPYRSQITFVNSYPTLSVSDIRLNQISTCCISALMWTGSCVRNERMLHENDGPTEAEFKDTQWNNDAAGTFCCSGSEWSSGVCVAPKSVLEDLLPHLDHHWTPGQSEGRPGWTETWCP